MRPAAPPGARPRADGKRADGTCGKLPSMYRSKYTTRVSRSLQAILFVGFYVRDLGQCAFELVPIEEPGTGLDVFAAGKAICQHFGHELFHGDVPPPSHLFSW